MSDELKLKAADIVSSYLSKHELPPEEIPKLLQSIIDTLVGKPAPQQAASAPAVPVEESIHHDYLVCLEDGARVKMLRRYLQTHFGLSIEEYRLKWGLPADYPVVCEAYSQARRQIAKDQGLGRQQR